VDTKSRKVIGEAKFKGPTGEKKLQKLKNMQMIFLFLAY
jgi:hypothetical protein